MRKLDARDRRLLFELDRNSRATFARLAHSVRMNKEVVRYRVLGYLESEMIRPLLLVLLPPLGFFISRFFITFQNVDEEKEREMVNYLMRKHGTIYVASTDGKYDLAFTVCVRDFLALSNFIEDFTDKFSAFIAARDMTFIVRSWFLPRTYLVADEREPVSVAVSQPSKEIKKLDSKDVRILKALGEDARAPVVEIARKMGLSADAVSARIKKLEREKTIAQYSIVLDNNQIEQRRYKVFINFHSITPETEKSLYDYCNTHPKIVYVVKAIGAWDFEFDVELA
ncbi:MAG: Lrp/AsnC family transcriptional regulator, partial [Candidatus Micrarchaeota archaeon]